MEYVELNQKDQRFFKAIYKAYKWRNSKSERKKKIYDLTLQMFPFLQGTGNSHTKYNSNLRNFFSEVLQHKKGIVIYSEGEVPSFYLSKDSCYFSFGHIHHLYNVEKGKIH